LFCPEGTGENSPAIYPEKCVVEALNGLKDRVLTREKCIFGAGQ